MQKWITFSIFRLTPKRGSPLQSTCALGHQAFGYNINDLDLQEFLGQPGDPWDTIMQNTIAGLGEALPAKSLEICMHARFPRVGTIKTFFRPHRQLASSSVTDFMASVFGSFRACDGLPSCFAQRLFRSVRKKNNQLNKKLPWKIRLEEQAPLKRRASRHSHRTSTTNHAPMMLRASRLSNRKSTTQQAPLSLNASKWFFLGTQGRMYY